jgi:hypothetical protein
MRKQIKQTLAFFLTLVMMVVLTPIISLPVNAADTAADYCDTNRIDVKTIVIVIDAKGVGETALKQEWTKLSQMYYDIGENLVVKESDWLYYTKSPFNLPLPIGDDTSVESLDYFLPRFFSNISAFFNWQRVFIYEDGRGLEPKIYGPVKTGYTRRLNPDAVVGISTKENDPFGKNFIVNGFSACDDDTGFHGTAHEAESLMGTVTALSVSDIDEIYNITNTFYSKYGDAHYIPGYYLESIGVTPDPSDLANPVWANGAKFYEPESLSSKQMDVYYVQLLQKMRSEFDLLRYYYRFYNWSEDNPDPQFPPVSGTGATTPPAPVVTTTAVVTTTQAPVTTTSATTTEATTTTTATTTEVTTTAPETTAVVGEEATTSETAESETSVISSEATTTSTALLTSTEAVTATTTVQPAITTGETLTPQTAETENRANLGVILAIVASVAVIVTAITVIAIKRGKNHN